MLISSGARLPEAEATVTELVVRNDSPHPGYVLAAKVERRSDGTVLAEATSLDVPLGTNSELVHVPVGRMPPAFPDGVRSDWPADEPAIVCTIEFTDAARLARWRQRSYADEGATIAEQPDGTQMFAYSYNDHGREEPQRVGVDPDAARPRRGRLTLAWAALRGRLG